MRTSIFTLLLFLILVGQSYAQQEAQFSQNMFNHMAINPAFAGSNEAICFTGLARQQWYGIKDQDGNNVAPQTFLVSMDAPVRILHGGLGGTIFQDQLGYEKNIGLRLSYSYRFNLGSGNLGVGAQLSLLNKKIDFSKFKPIDPDDPILITGSNDKNFFMTDFGFGLFYKVPSRYYVGFSMSQLSEGKQTVDQANYKLKRHYYLTGGYEYILPGNPEYEIDPSVLIKSDGASTQFDINALLRYNNRYWGGVSYRIQDAVAILLGMNIQNFRVGYSYDITTSRLSRAGSMGSHEIMVGYCFKIIIEKPRKSYRNTRFL